MGILDRARHALLAGLSLETFAVMAGTIALAAAIELVCNGWNGSSIRLALLNRRSFANDLLASVMNIAGWGKLLGFVLLLGLPAFVVSAAQARHGYAVQLPVLPGLAISLGVFVVADFMAYWFHRLCHHVPLLWSVHRYHHSAKAMTLFTAGRIHPIEAALTSAWTSLPYFFVQISPQQMFVPLLPVVLHGLLRHSNIRADWGWFGRYVAQSPAAHRVHHATDPAYFNSNYASVLAIWDVLFGTAGEPVPVETIGLADDTGTDRPLHYIAATAWQFWATLVEQASGRSKLR